ncbi:DUF4870 domain-containing protein [Truepera radiovictrix]|uniref:DUF4870 domain-containing protein n=1 Tax=Truepera radiovictrix (strain DSM 17093 / CIP 108686 / LMG 22925 / RQ-24) TaxID=649638 RepID=D7CSL7_TRURR|nr:DUF4870 domain-containing protein [Truepera radiovictrix]ADI15437.1 conserved hypothetical protein [Truepera radiovictrix DSM 17093]WMT56013.1 DUF4870 domain-containing protein [Truepera radiovictrix]
MDETQADLTGAPTPLSPTPDEVRWGILAHLSLYVVFLGLPSAVGPLAVWLLRRGESAFGDAQALEALNFGLSALIYLVGLSVLGVAALIGGSAEGLALVALALLALVVGSLVLPVVAAVRASSGERYRYPLTLRLL